MWIHLKYVMGMLMFQSIRILRNMEEAAQEYFDGPS